MQTCVSRLAVDPDDWALFLVAPLDIGGPGSMLLVIRGTAFLTLPFATTADDPLPFPTVEVLPSVRLGSDVPRIRAHQLMALGAVREVAAGGG
jgi:hypothetical protein